MVLVAGAAFPLAFSPFDVFVLAPVCVAALLLAWRSASPKRAFWLGFAFGEVSFLAGMHWVYISIHYFGETPAILAAVLTIALVTVLAAFIAVTGWVAARWFETDGAWAWLGVVPALWVLAEWCRGWFFSGLGWLSVGYSQTDSWLMGYAPVGGVLLMSWAAVLTAGALVTLLLGASRARTLAAGIIAVIWVAGYGLQQYRWTGPNGDIITVALVQGAVAQDLKWQPQQLLPTIELYRRLTEGALGSTLIVWPEAAIPALYEEVSAYLDDLRRWAQDHGSAVLLGILRRDTQGQSFQNTLAALGETTEFYVKRHLVPYGEYFPVPDFARRWLRLMSLPVAFSDATPGPPRQPPLSIAGQRVGATICYEDAFGAEQLHYLPEATLLVNVSNDAWFGDSIAPHQHLQIARVRAVETGRYMLRATNTGVSAIIDPSGRIVGQSPQFEPHLLKGAVQGFLGRTPYAVCGNYLAVVCASIVLAFQLLTTKFTIRLGT
jgi:apolipoprotein N-acyltransferase